MRGRHTGRAGGERLISRRARRCSRELTTQGWPASAAAGSGFRAGLDIGSTPPAAEAGMFAAEMQPAGEAGLESAGMRTPWSAPAKAGSTEPGIHPI